MDQHIPESFTEHPAEFTQGILEGVKERDWIPFGIILDPFGGTGRRLNEVLGHPNRTIIAIEIEPAFVQKWPQYLTLGDATSLPFQNDWFDGAITSPAYAGIRFADYNRPKTPSNWKGRRGYDLSAKFLSRDETYVLAPNNTASHVRSTGTQETYWMLHEKAWTELYRVLKPGTPFVFNYKPRLNDDGLERHNELLDTVGFQYKDQFIVPTKGYAYGANGSLRDPVGERVQLWFKN